MAVASGLDICMFFGAQSEGQGSMRVLVPSRPRVWLAWVVREMDMVVCRARMLCVG